MFFLHFPQKIYDAILADPSIPEAARYRTFLIRNSALNFAIMLALCLIIGALWGVLQWERMLGVAVLCLVGSVFDSARQYTVLSDPTRR